MSKTETTNPGGINVWLNKKAAAAVAGTTGEGAGPLEIDLDLLDPNPKQPRRSMDEVALEELMASIRLYGVMQAISVTKQGNGRYFILAGHRRAEAVKRLRDAAPADERAKFVKIAARDRGPTATDELAELALTENLLRDDLRPIETAEALAELRDARGFETADDVAKALGLELTKTKRYLQLAGAPPTVRQALATGIMVELGDDTTAGGKPRREHRTLDLAHAIAILRAHKHWMKAKPKKAADLTRALVEKVLKEGWSLKKLSEHIDSQVAGKAESATPSDEGKGGEPGATTGKPVFTADAARVVVNRARLTEASAEERSALRKVLQELLSELA